MVFSVDDIKIESSLALFDLQVFSLSWLLFFFHFHSPTRSELTELAPKVDSYIVFTVCGCIGNMNSINLYRHI